MEEKTNLYKNLKPFLSCKDHSVSKEDYELMLNENYELLVTHPVPANLENYYESKNYISHTDSKRTFFDKVYQAVRRYTLKKKVYLLNSFKTEEKTVLDVGAGTGDFLYECKKNNWKVFGIEPSVKAIKIAAKKNVFLKEKISDFDGQKFDVITLWHVLEHVEDLPYYIKKLKELLKQKGTLLIAVPNYKSYDAQFYKECWAAYDVPRHLWHFSQKSIAMLFSEISMDVVSTIPMKFDAYYVSLLSEKYKSGHMNLLNAFWKGFLSNYKAKKSSEYSSLIYRIKNK